MAVTAQGVVDTRLRPVLVWSDDLSTDIVSIVEQETIAQGWNQPLSEEQELYVGLLTCRSLIARLIAHCLVEAQKERSGDEWVEWEERAKLLRLLAEQIEDEISDAAHVGTPDEPEEAREAPPPHVGIFAI